MSVEVLGVILGVSIVLGVRNLVIGIYGLYQEWPVRSLRQFLPIGGILLISLIQLGACAGVIAAVQTGLII